MDFPKTNFETQTELQLKPLLPDTTGDNPTTTTSTSPSNDTASRIVPMVSLNWSGVMGNDLPYKRFAFGVDGGAAYNLSTKNPVFAGFTGGYHKMKLEKGPGPDGSYFSAGPVVGFGRQDTARVYMNLHWAGAYEFDEQRMRMGPELGVTLGAGLYVHAGVFMPDFSDQDSWAGVVRIGIGG